ncbi:hypothetical protein SUGI_0432680 [Cryptomeria japonica]|nr:hypothetical protein SUGI_0432680 [Cryptomeria japonica]
MCKKMDVEGLLSFLVDKKKDLMVLCWKVQGVLKVAPKVIQLMLKALKWFHMEGNQSEKEHSLFMQQRKVS